MAVRVLNLICLLACMVPLCASSAPPFVATPNQASNPTPTGTGPSCAQSDPSIPNGDFESGSLGTWGAFIGERSDGSVTVVSPGYNSNYAAQLTGNWFVGMAQSFMPACEATNYSVTFDYKVVEADASCKITVRSTRSSYPLGDVYILPEAGDWTSSSFSFGIYVAEAFGISATIDCKGKNTTATLLLDNFAVTTIGSLEPSACPRSPAFLDGGFDSGTLANWQMLYSDTPPYSIVSPGYDSEYALQVDFPTVDNLGTAGFTLKTYIQDLCVAYEYTYSFAMNWGNYSAAPNIQGTGCYIATVPLNCAQQSQAYWDPPTTPNSGWQNASFTCRSVSSQPTEYLFTVSCEVNEAAPIPAFDFQVDSFAVMMTP